ncbi:Type I Iterative PKS [Arachnomyces sp. PD_36]|nr:Type I Iterative PKS [Arachnomyces sp. PD_36]
MAAPSGDVAIVGMSCRFPGGGEGVDGFWQSISSGQSAWSEVPSNRFNASAFFSPHKRSNASITRSGFFLKDHDLAAFDGGFFTLPKTEVLAMDPQQRLLIEVAYEALESAGLSLPKVAGSRTGVYVGVFTHDYYDMIRKDAENMPAFTVHGTASTAMAGRLSWLWDLRGPSFALDTACSSSLVALHLAVQSLRAGESDAALVGGTNLLIAPDMFKVGSSATFLAPDGRSKAFDESADGYGRGEGIGVLVLKRVEDAIRDGDPIRAVIRGTGCNQDGRTPGMTLPSSEAQAALIRHAYDVAGVNMHETGYVEAHGTGTQAGDQQETKSLSTTIALDKKQSKNEKLLIGSVKSNIGHLEACAGVAAVIKTVLVLEHGLIPPTPTAKTLNSKIPFAAWNLSVPTTLTPFPGSGLRRASVNSFGFCGTNAHAILDDAYSYLKSRGVTDGNHFTRQSGKLLTNGTTNGINGTTGHHLPLVLALSAQDRDGIKRVRKTLAEFLGKKDKTSDKHTREYLIDLAHTLNTRRTHHQWKTYAIASSVPELVDELNDEETPRPAYLGGSRSPRLGFVFTGQGAQWGGMGMELMTYPVFSASILAADNYLRTELGCAWSAEEELRRPKVQSKLGIAEYSQPLCTILQVALVDLLSDWGIKPAAVTGHSSGEIGAAYCLGALTREDAWKVAYYRGVLSTSLRDANGAMMAAGMAPDKAAELIEQVAPGEVTVACINSPSSVTLSGDAAGIDKFLAALTKDGIFARKLQVDTAYHSHHMQMVASDYMEAVMDIETKPAVSGCVMQSSASGTAITASELGSAHWVRNLVSPVQFAAAVQELVRPSAGKSRATENAVDVLIEVGPHSALQGPSLQTLKAINVTDVPYLSALSRWEDGSKTCLALAGDLFTRSFPVDVVKANEAASFRQRPRVLAGLPTYPWNHQQRYWAETRWAREQRMREFPPLSLLGAPQPSVVAGEHAWRGYMRMREQAWIADHKVQGSVLYPGAGFLAMAIEAAAQVADPDREVCGFRLQHIQLVLPMVLEEDRDVEYSIVLRPHLTGTMSTSSIWTEFVISSSPDGKTFERNCLGLIKVEYGEAGQTNLLDSESLRQHIDDIAAKCKVPLAPPAFYERLESLGLAYGPSFAKVSSMRVREGQSTAVIDVPDVGLEDVQRTGLRPHVIHPAVLDAVFHVIFGAIWGAGELATAMIPKTIDSVIVSTDAPFRLDDQFSGVCKTRRQGFNEYMADVYMEDHKTKLPALKVEGLCCAKVAGDTMAGDITAASSELCTQMVWRPHLQMLDDSGLAELGLTTKEGSVSSKLAKIISLMHHANPGMELVEIATSNKIMLPTSEIDAGVFLTTSYQVACSEETNEAVQELLSHLEMNVTPRMLDLKDVLSGDKLTADSFVIATNDVSENSRRNIEALAEKLASQGGTLCIIDKPSTSSSEPLLIGDKMKTSLVLEDAEQVARIITKQDIDTNIENSTPEEVVILSCGNTAVETSLFHNLRRQGFNPVVVQWADANAPSAIQNRRCISLVELEISILERLSNEDFTRLVNMAKSALHVSWVVGSDVTKPSTSMITGMLRVFHNEMPGFEPIAISADTSSRAQPEQLARHIARIFALPMGDREFQILNGIPHVSRVLPDEPLNNLVDDLTRSKDAQEPEMMTYEEVTAKNYPLRLNIGKPGQLDSIHFKVDDRPERPLLPDEIEIDVKVSALNFRDVMSIMALIPTPTLGVEASGTVRRVGSAVTHLKVADRVALVGNDAHATVFRGKGSHAFKIPDSMTFQEAASLPVVAYTAWYALVRLARARKGQTVLIHAGSGGVGQAAIQLANDLGLEVFTTVSTEEKHQLLRDKYGVADDHIFGSRDLAFAREVMKMTDGRGVNIVLNSLAGEALHKSWECVASNGHFIELGLKDIVDNTRLGMRPFMCGASFSSFNVKDLWDNHVDLMAEVVEGAKPYLVNGIIKPADPLVSYPVTDLVKALRLLQSGKHKGKLVMEWTPDSQVQVVRSSTPPLRLEHGNYLLVGGMGGLGRSITRMLVSLGARKFCFLSRSAGTSTEARYLLEELAEKGAEARVVACDVSDPASVNAALNQCVEELGPIRGVFQCAAVLRDALFTNMTYKYWTESTQSKVQGSQNLSAALPDVDFFILLSSYAGVFGNRGQANYAAGCAFQDALAQERHAKGQSAVSVDLGQMRDVGALAENGAQGDIKEWEKVWGIHEDKFLALMRLCMQANELGIGPRVVTGVGTRAGSLEAGIKVPYYFDTDPRFGVLARVGGAGNQDSRGAGSDSQEQALSTTIPRATTVQDAASLVLAALVERVAKMLDIPSTDLDTERFLYSYGVDSLGAIEIVNWALREVQARIAVFDVMAGVSMTIFSERVAAKSGLLPKQLVEVN